MHSITLTLLLPTLLCGTAQANNNTHQCPPTFINNPNFTANPISNNPNYHTTISPTFNTNTTSTINAVGMQMRDITLQIIEKAQKTFSSDNYNNAKTLIKQLIWYHRHKIAATTVFAVYSSASVLLLTDYHYLNNSMCWSRWKADYSFESLCAIPHNELEQELIRAIGEHHYNKKNPTDLSHPLITFIETIEAEINICKRYLAMAKNIKKLHLCTIFPTNDTKIEHVNNFLERALFIRHIFLSWLADRNLNTKSLKRSHTALLLNRKSPIARQFAP